MPEKRVAVAMSGGIDSSVAGALLKEEGYKVIGLTMKIWNGREQNDKMPDTSHACYGPGEAVDIKDVEKVADQLEIPFFVFDLRDEYESQVLDYFQREYLKGRTPNPCAVCNKRIKFGTLYRKAKESGIAFDYFATGHYVRVEYYRARERYILKRARDRKKDQSYFLYGLSQAQLSRSIFPLGELSKEEVRRKAKNLNLSIYDKDESQDFFAGDYTSLIKEPSGPGPILNQEGERVGEHKGIYHYTIGQRKGLGIKAPSPLYVVDIKADENAVVVGPQEQIYKDWLVAANINWITIKRLKEPMKVIAKIRYRHSGANATLFPLEEGNRMEVRFKEPQRAITPGQVVVFYEDERVIGGGIIER